MLWLAWRIPQETVPQAGIPSQNESLRATNMDNPDACLLSFMATTDHDERRRGDKRAKKLSARIADSSTKSCLFVPGKRILGHTWR